MREINLNGLHRYNWRQRLYKLNSICKHFQILFRIALYNRRLQVILDEIIEIIQILGFIAIMSNVYTFTLK